MMNKLLLVITLCCAFIMCYNLVVASKTPGAAYAAEEGRNDDIYDRQEVIVVSKTRREVCVEGIDSSEFYSWYEIGLSRNGEEPVEYIWRLGSMPPYNALRYAEIGDRGTIRLDWLAKEYNMELPRPNAENPPTIGMFGEVYWERRE